MSRPVRYGYGDVATWPSIGRDPQFMDRNDPRFDNEAWERLEEMAFDAGMTVDQYLRQDAANARDSYEDC